ncbi:MAG: DUF6036 family nucleotidyltransferase [Acidimicrobiia bacterium]
MKRQDFDHVVRAAGAILGEREVLVIGSQAVHASMPEPLPEEAERSVEADVVAFDDADGRKADLIDGTIGEASMFQESFGIYAQGVSEKTAYLPVGWRDRLVRYETPATAGVVAWCLELHDLWISKAIAGRPKDREFCGALLARQVVDREILRHRALEVPEAGPGSRDRVLAWVNSIG